MPSRLQPAQEGPRGNHGFETIPRSRRVEQADLPVRGTVIATLRATTIDAHAPYPVDEVLILGAKGTTTMPSGSRTSEPS